MHVAFVVGGLPFGGVESLTLLTAKELIKRGHRPTIINISGTGEYEKAYLEAGIRPLHVGESKKVLKTTSLRTPLKLRRMFRELKADLIHTSHFSADYHVRLANFGTDTPIITHCRNIKREKKISRRLANKLLSFRTTRYLAVSNAVGEIIQRDHNLAGRPISTLYNVISTSKMDVPSVDLTELGVRQQGEIIVCCSRIVKQKNLDVVIRAMPRVLERLPDAQLLILGDGPEREALELLADSLGVGDSTIFTGFRLDVPNILQALSNRVSVFAMPSDYEGFSNSLTEAMYCALPSVISEFVPNKEITAESASVVAISFEALAEEFVSILGNSERYHLMSKSAQEIASELTIERYVDQLLEIYGSVV